MHGTKRPPSAITVSVCHKSASLYKQSSSKRRSFNDLEKVESNTNMIQHLESDSNPHVTLLPGTDIYEGEPVHCLPS